MKICLVLAACLLLRFAPHAAAQLPDSHDYDASDSADQGSVYVPIDSWVYPALDRLHALGYADTAFLGLRPWTRLSIVHILEESEDAVQNDTGNDEARTIFAALMREFQPDQDRAGGAGVEIESVYTNLRGISGTPLRDSFHLGQTLVNDYGRPYQGGFSNYSGFSGHAEDGRFSFYFRGEFQHAPSAAGYSTTLSAFLSNNLDFIPYSGTQAFSTIPQGPIPAAENARILEAYLSYHLLNHEISLGKSDHWLGPDQGASMLWSTNAEDIYDFEINRVEPLRIPLLSRITGPFRYDFFVGALQGHTFVPNPAYQANPSPNVPNAINPGNPWVHMEKISFKPFRDLEFGFDRMAIWGGKGHAPITLHTFLHSFFSFQNVPVTEKNGPDDPGYRLGTFDFTWRLPFLSHWVTLYTDSLVHDDVSPVAAPTRAGYHSGIYLARFPGLQHLDLRLEGGSTNTVSASLQAGQFLYWETIQRQGPTNQGFLVGDWLGRQGTGGQAWLTWHLSPQEDLQLQYRRAKAASGFIPGGTTQNDYAFSIRRRVKKDIEIRGFVQFEGWKAPIYKSGLQHDTAAEAQITWYPSKSK